MKRLYPLFSVMLFLLFAAGGCTEPEEFTPTLSLSEAKIAVPCTGTVVYLDVTSNVEWVASAVGGNIEIEPASGRGDARIKVTVGPNSGENIVKELVMLQTTDKLPLVSICEMEREAYPEISLSRETVLVYYTEGKYSVNLTCNKKWKSVVEGDFISSIEPSEGEGSANIIINVTANEGGENSGKITFSTDDAVVVTAEVEVVQYAYPVIIPRGVPEIIPPAGGTYKVIVDSNTDWEIIDPADGEGGFFTVTPQSGTLGETELTLTVRANEGDAREETLVFSSVGDSPVTVPVNISQALLPLISVTPTLVKAPMEGGEFVVAIKSNTDWSVADMGTLVSSVTPSNGKGDAEVTVVVDSKVGAGGELLYESTVTFRTDGDEYAEAVLDVMQDASPMVAVNPITINTGTAVGGTYKAQINSNADWQVKSTGPGIVSVTPASGSGNQEVSVTIAENPGAARTETVVFETVLGSAEATLSLTQPVVMSVNPTFLRVPAEAGSYTIEISTHAPWTAASSSGIMLPVKSGVGNSALTLQLGANETASSRTEQVTITAYDLILTVEVTQYGPSIQYGGETYEIVKLADGRWWMADNLRYVPEGMRPSATHSIQAGIWYPYRKDVQGEEEVDVPLMDAASISYYGYLYDYMTALKISPDLEDHYNNYKTGFEGMQGICPDGWHIPTQGEVNTMLGKYKRGDNSTYYEDLEEAGFKVIPGGMRKKNDLYYETGTLFSATNSEYILTSTGGSHRQDRGKIMMRALCFVGASGKAIMLDQSMLAGSHVRCIKNE